MSLTAINHNNGIDISRFSEKKEIAELQADTLRHAFSVSAQLQAEVSPEYQATKRVRIKTEAEVETAKGMFDIAKFIILGVCFFGFLGFAAKQQVPVPVVRTVHDGDLEATNKILQRDLMLTKSELDTKIREVEMLSREFKELKEKSEIAGGQ